MLQGFHRAFAPSRRTLLRGGAAAGAVLVIGFHMAGRGAIGQTVPAAGAAPANALLALSLFSQTAIIRAAYDSRALASAARPNRYQPTILRSLRHDPFANWHR